MGSVRATGPAIHLIRRQRYQRTRFCLAKMGLDSATAPSRPSMPSTKIVLVAVLSAPLVALTIVMGSFNLVQAAVSAPWPDPA
jgi:hypothetical protein